MTKHFFSYLNETIKRDWSAPALSDFDGNKTYTYGKMAEEMTRLMVLFEAMGLKKGDKIALCGRNCADWAVAFLAVSAYQGVAVSILADFPADSVHALVNHSDAKLLFCGPIVWKNIDANKMPNIKGILSLTGFELLHASSPEISSVYFKRDELWEQEFAAGFSAKDVCFVTDNLDDLALINYTSGTTSSPKGVMLTYKNISSNVQFGQERIPNKAGWKTVSMLPLAHMFGLTFEFLYQLAGGCQVYFLSKTPSPQVLLKAFAEVHPYMILTVPLVIEKIFKNKIFPIIHKPILRILWYLPLVGNIIKKKVYQQLMDAFGGHVLHLIIGGAALNREVENCLKAIRFPYTVGYGMTECAPLLAYEDWKHFKQRSCGKVVNRMQVRIDSDDPQRVVGEIQVNGDNMMLGYYKNAEATASSFTEDGWLRTGDLGIVDAQGNIFIRGRSKSMILGASGQNIYPEEIEDKLNNLEGVVESVVVARDGKLVGLVFPDYELEKNATMEGKALTTLMQENLVKLNRLLPTFCRLTHIELVKKEFEKTPKRSIKRFLYK